MAPLGSAPHDTELDGRDLRDAPDVRDVRVEERRHTDRTQPLPQEEPLVVAAPPGAPIDPLGDRAPAGPPGPRRTVPRTVWFFVVIGVLIVAMGLATTFVIRALGDANPFKNGFVTQRTIDRSGPAVLKAVSDLGTLQSASGYYEIVIDVQQEVEHVPSFLAGRRVLFVAAGTVDASVNLRDLAAGDVTVNADRSAAAIRLAKPRLSQPQLDVNRSYVYSQERGLIDALHDLVSPSTNDEKQLYQRASQRLTQAAQANNELVNRAEANTRTTLQGLLRPLGFTDVTVTFSG
jgi:Protein of unknown function (DUF4230)